MTITTRYQRKLSAIERYNLVINSLCRYNVEGIIEGKGTLDPLQWQQAVNLAAEVNPGVRTRLKSFLGFSKWVDSGIAPEVKVINATEWDGMSDKGTEFLQQPFDAKNGGPVCDVLLLPGDTSRIIVRGLHAAMDARGLTHFAHEIFRILRGESPIGATDTITDLDIRLEHQDKVKVTETDKINSIPALPAHPADDHSIRYRWRRVRINQKISNALPKTAVFLAQQARKHAEGDVSFTIPVDFRGLRHDAQSTANLTGYIRISVGPDETPKEVMRKINQQIRDYADCQNPGYLAVLPWIPIRLMESMLAKKAHRLLYSTNDELPTAGIVSLGHFDSTDYCYPGFQATGAFGIPGSVGKLNVVLQNYSDCAEVIFTIAEGYNTQGQLDTLIQEFKSAFEA